VGVYNKTLLAEAGIEAPTTLEDAWTWSELLEVAKKLTTPERYGISFHNEIGEQVTYFYSPMVVENGLDLVSPDGSTATGYLNSDATLKAIQTLKGFYDAKVANVAPTATEFHDGKSAMLLGGAHQIGNLAKYPDVDWGLTYYPAADDGTLKCPTGSWAFAITSNAKDPDGAWLFLDWMTNTKLILQAALPLVIYPTATPQLKRCLHITNIPGTCL
jgi:fructooligosaccharide transport system substrate-binding protein